jgi:hypothetical protein
MLLCPGTADGGVTPDGAATDLPAAFDSAAVRDLAAATDLAAPTDLAISVDAPQPQLGSGGCSVSRRAGGSLVILFPLLVAAARRARLRASPRSPTIAA